MNVGENHTSHKLTAKQAKEIYDLYAEGNTTIVKLAETYGVSSSAVYRITQGWAWKAVTGGKPIENGRHYLKSTGHPGEEHPCHRLKEAQVIEIRRAWANGEPQKSIGDRYGIHASTVSAIVNNRTWSHLPSAWEMKKGDAE